MKINSLHLENFKQYKNEFITFPEGLIGFIGSNGAGKSTIFEAISLALYGKFETSKEHIKNDNASAKDNVVVELEFEDKGKCYKVKRELKGKNLKAETELFIENISSAASVKEANKEIIKALKIDYANFKNSFFASQKEVTSLLKLNSRERETAIRKMLGLEKLDKLNDKIKDRRKELDYEIRVNEKNLLSVEKLNEFGLEKKKKETALDEEQTKLSSASEGLKNFNKFYDAVKQKLQLSESLKKKFDKLSNEIEITKVRISSNNEQISKTLKEIDSLKESQKELQLLEPQKDSYLKVNESYENLLKVKSEFERKTALEKNLEDRKDALNDFKTKKAAVDFEIESLKDIDNKIEITKNLIEAKDEIKRAREQTKALLNDQISKAEGIIDESKARLERIKKIGKQSPCPECERPLEEHFDNLLKKYNDQISNNECEIISKEKDLEQIVNEIKKIDIELKELNRISNQYEVENKNLIKLRKEKDEQVGKINYTTNKISELKVQLQILSAVKFDQEELNQIYKCRETLRPLYDKYNKIKTKTEELPKKENEKLELKKKESELQNKLTELNKNLSEVKFDPSKHEELKQQREESEDKLNKLKENVHQIEKDISVITNRISEIQNEINRDKQLRKDIEKLKNKSNLLKRLEAFVVEFKSQVTSQELPAISNEASRLFSTITKNRYRDLKIDSYFNFIVSRDDKVVDLDTLSGGEKDLASLCIRVAISKRISALAGRTNMGFLAMDEVFGSQDEERREELLSALCKISEEFKQIFVISHSQNVQEQFPTRLMITKKGDYSCAELFI